MRRLILLGVLAATAAQAQPADCPAQPVGPPMPLTPEIQLGGRQRARLPVDLGAVPMQGTLCAAPEAPPPENVLRGTPTARGLLQGDGPRDVLHNRWQGEVTIRSPSQTSATQSGTPQSSTE